jgi:hypothetical protein
MPVTVVPTSLATVAIETFMTELSSVIRNWPAARVSKTTVAPPAGLAGAISAVKAFDSPRSPGGLSIASPTGLAA